MVWWSLVACGPATMVNVPAEVVASEEPTPAAPPTVRRQLCMYGATEIEDGANPWIDDLCEDLPEVVRHPETGRAGFRIYEIDDARTAMLDLLDTDGDGLVTDDDEAVIDVLGYSWGGVNAVQLALQEEEGVTVTRPLIGRLVLIDPFIPPHDEPLLVGGPIEEVWSYGHSASPSWDCSAFAPFGPYRSRPVDCDSTDAPCTLYDLSLDRDVGHCSIVWEVEDWAVTNLLEGTSPAPAALIP